MGGAYSKAASPSPLGTSFQRGNPVTSDPHAPSLEREPESGRMVFFNARATVVKISRESFGSLLTRARLTAPTSAL